MLQSILSFWWIIIPIIAIAGYKFVFRVFFGMVIIPEDKVGLVTKKFVLFGPNKALPDGKIIALNGEPGFQADTLAPGFYRRGNVKIFCSRNNIPFFNNIEDAIGSLMTKLHNHKQ